MSTLLDQKTRASIDTYLESARRSLRLPGLAVAVIQEDRVIYVRGLGLAGPGQGVCPETSFVLGSLSKSFTALAVMQLVEAGQISLDNRVNTYLPWFCLVDVEASASITVRHLLTHTSGISRRAGRDLLARSHDIGLEATVRALHSVKLVHEPGQVYEYSNTNYSILGLLIEQASGLPYESYIQQHIFAPLGMTNSFTSELVAETADLASGNRWWFGWPVRFRAPYLRDALPAAFLVSSAQDMARWLLAHLGGGAVDGVSILSPAGIEELHRGQIATGKKGQYAALGWRVGQFGGEQVLQHGGEVSNYRADMMLFPGRRLGLVVLTNCNNGLVAQLGLDQIAPGVARLLLGQPPAQKRLTPRAFAGLSAGASLALLGMELWRWLRLRRSSRRPTPGGILALASDLLAPIAALRQLPRLADMGWRGLRLYVPDLSRLVLILSGLSLARAGVRVLRWLRFL